MAIDEDAEWHATRASLVAAVRSGLFTGREVMDRLGITAGEWRGWCRADQVARSRAAGRAESPRGAAFARVALVGPAPQRACAVVLLRGGRRLRVHPGFDAAEVRRLAEALEPC